MQTPVPKDRIVGAGLPLRLVTGRLGVQVPVEHQGPPAPWRPDVPDEVGPVLGGALLAFIIVDTAAGRWHRSGTVARLHVTPARSGTPGQVLVAFPGYTMSGELLGAAFAPHLSEHDAMVVATSPHLSRRAQLAEDLAAAPPADVLLVELKGAAVDVAVPMALEKGMEVVFCDNRPASVGGDGDLDALTLSAADPLNLQGILTPGPRIAALTANRVLFRDGMPIAALEAGEIRRLYDAPVSDLQIETALRVGKLRPSLRPYYK